MNWHERRRTGVGGSDIAAILGLSRYSTATDVWRVKIGWDQPTPSSEAAQRGTDLEPRILAHMGAIEAPQFVPHPQWEDGVRLLANADGYLGDAIAEAKSTIVWRGVHQQLRRFTVPVSWLLQVHAYMMCHARDRAVIQCAVGPGNDVSEWVGEAVWWWRVEVPMCDDLCAVIAASAMAFWRCVEDMVPPRDRLTASEEQCAIIADAAAACSVVCEGPDE